VKAADVCFPNKVVAYLANGLHVVSSKSRPVQESTLTDFITFYDTDTPESVAAAVLSVPPPDPEAIREMMRHHDQGFRESLAALLDAVKV